MVNLSTSKSCVKVVKVIVVMFLIILLIASLYGVWDTTLYVLDKLDIPRRFILFLMAVITTTVAINIFTYMIMKILKVGRED